MTATLDRQIEVTPEVCGGKPRLGSRRIRVQDVAIWHERLAQSADEVAAEHDLALADVYAALAYYDDHRPEIDAALRGDADFVEQLRRWTPSKLAARLHGGA